MKTVKTAWRHTNLWNLHGDMRTVKTTVRMKFMKIAGWHKDFENYRKAWKLWKLQEDIKIMKFTGRIENCRKKNCLTAVRQENCKTWKMQKVDNNCENCRMTWKLWMMQEGIKTVKNEGRHNSCENCIKTWKLWRVFCLIDC